MIANPTLRSILGHHWQVALALSLTAFSVSAAASLMRWPTPAIHDEFSYLLAADTFCHGRCANPTHPFWQHFETFHVIHRPSYASKYPPGQGLVLAGGQWLTGQPIVGIWILTALTAAACYWMLLGWVPAHWATVGGLLFLVHPGYQFVWGQSYWGGTLAFLGSSLVFGAAARMRQCPQLHDAIAMSLGALILAISRPYEGFIFCLLVGLLVIVLRWQLKLPAWRVFVQKAILPQAVVLLIGGACLAYYNHAVTGSWRTMPYRLHESTYGLSPCFLWNQPYEEREYRHNIISKFHHGWEMESYRKQRSIAGFLKTKSRQFINSWNHFFPLPMILPILFVPFCRARYKWTVLIVASIAWLSTAATVWNLPQYLAPTAPVLMILVLMGLRQANVWGKKYLNLPRLANLFVIWQILFFTVSFISYSQAPQNTWQWRRAAILQQLKASPERHLVFVHYDPDHKTHQEWVYNRADIDRSKVVWAREMGMSRDRKLMDYFHSRKVWLLDADSPQPRLRPMVQPPH